MSTEKQGDPADAAVHQHPGILRADIDAGEHELTIEFDPRLISEDEVRVVAEELAPPAHQQYCKSLLHLGGRASGAAAQRIERKAQGVTGIRRARATFLGGVMTVTFDDAQISESQMIESVRRTGAHVRPFIVKEEGRPEGFRAWVRYWLEEDRLEVVFTVLTFVFMVAGWALSKSGSRWHDVLYVAAYLTGGYFGVRAGLQSLRQWTIDVDLLMVLAALGAAVVDAAFEGAMLLFLFSLSNVLQAYAFDRTRRAIQSLMKLRPEQALVRRDGATATLPIEELVVGDVLIVRPGESIALDGQITEGVSAVDQSSLTGESIPVAKKVGDPVFAGTINQTGGLEVCVTRLAKDSAIEKLVRMVEEAQTEKAETQRFLDRAEQFYAMGVILFTVALIVWPLLFGDGNFKAAFYRAMTVMVVASPCALIISTPATILSAIGGAARRGVLFKGGVHLENAATIRVVAFDKTGTLTEGKPHVTDVVVGDRIVAFRTAPGAAAIELLELAAAVEAKSEHPLAQAIVTEAKRLPGPIPECSDFQSVSGKGASGTVGGRRISVGSLRHFSPEELAANEPVVRTVSQLQDEGKTCAVVGERNPETGEARLLGAIAIADVLRADAPGVIRRLKAGGVRRIVMLTGDNARVANAIARQAGVDEFHADLLPEDKVRVVRELRTIGPVAMVGDGVNDAPALATATIGVAMGAAGTDVAMETADLVLMSNNLENIPFALELSRRSRRVIYQNLAFALGVIIILVASALGFGLLLPLGVVGHEGSTVLVCLNGLRMLAFGAKGRAAG